MDVMEQAQEQAALADAKWYIVYF
jgi:hypothetical protein